MYFFVTPVIGFTFNRLGYPLVTALIAGLCFLSASFVRTAPTLAKLGVITLLIPFPFLFLVGLAAIFIEALR